jgi:glycosyltransferase involved in cell wall biosynthesis
VASLPEVVLDGETGYVVPPGNPAALGAAIARVLADPAAAGAMGARGRARVIEHFSWSKVVERCLAAYRE